MNSFTLLELCSTLCQLSPSAPYVRLHRGQRTLKGDKSSSCDATCTENKPTQSVSRVVLLLMHNFYRSACLFPLTRITGRAEITPSLLTDRAVLEKTTGIY